MSKVRCCYCMYESNGYCIIKKDSISTNKSRRCEDFIPKDTQILSMNKEIPTTRIGYSEWQDIKIKAKEERKEIRRLIKEQPNNGTAKSLGLIDGDKSISNYGKFGNDLIASSKITNTKHPLTGDLSRFKTTADEGV